MSEILDKLSETVGELCKEYGRQLFELRQERDRLAADNARLRAVAGKIHHWHDWGKDNEGMVVSSSSVHELWDALTATPVQSLAAHDAALLREVARLVDDCSGEKLRAEADSIEREESESKNGEENDRQTQDNKCIG